MNRDQIRRYLLMCKEAGVSPEQSLKTLIEKKADFTKEAISPFILLPLIFGGGVAAKSGYDWITDEGALSDPATREAAKKKLDEIYHNAGYMVNPMNWQSEHLQGATAGGLAGGALGKHLFPEMPEWGARLTGMGTGAITGGLLGEIYRRNKEN